MHPQPSKHDKSVLCFSRPVIVCLFVSCVNQNYHSNECAQNLQNKEISVVKVSNDAVSELDGVNDQVCD